MEYTNMSFLYDFAFMSLLLIIAQFLRSCIKIFADVLYSSVCSGRSDGTCPGTAVFKRDSVER